MTNFPQRGDTNWGPVLQAYIDSVGQTASTALNKANSNSTSIANNDAKISDLASRINGAQTVAAALDFGSPINIALVGDSTANDPTDWPKTWAYMQRSSKPALQIEYAGFGKDTLVWTNHNPIQTVSTAASGGVVVLDKFGRSGDVKGSTPDTAGSSPWAGTTGALTANTGYATWSAVGALTQPVLSASMTTTAVLSITTAASSSAQAMRVVASCNAGTQGGGVGAHVYLTPAGAVSLYVYYLVGGTRQLGATLPLSGIIPSNSGTAKDLTVKVDVNIQNITVTCTTDLGTKTLTSQITEADYTGLGTNAGLALATASAPGFSVKSFQVETAATPSRISLLKLWNACVSGGTFANQLTNIDVTFPSTQQLDVLVLMMGHNYAGMSGTDFLAKCDEYVTAFLQRHPSAKVIVSSQNPEVNPAAGIDAHMMRQRALRVWAQNKGYSYIPAFEAFSKRSDGGTGVIISDGVHPTMVPTEGTTTGDYGAVVWASLFDAQVAKYRA